MKYLMAIIVLSILILVVLSFAGEGYDSILRNNMKRAGVPDSIAQEALNLPQRMSDIMVADSMKLYIAPTKFIWFKDNGMEAVVFNITDTIFGEVLYDESDVMRNK